VSKDIEVAGYIWSVETRGDEATDSILYQTVEAATAAGQADLADWQDYYGKDWVSLYVRELFKAS
tara:strand:+ start:763 stop:957 length:195 start_codon:yes stop_codon:yes gene_type:complete